MVSDNYNAIYLAYNTELAQLSEHLPAKITNTKIIPTPKLFTPKCLRHTAIHITIQGPKIRSAATAKCSAKAEAA